jgi:hypothetical protein
MSRSLAGHGLVAGHPSIQPAASFCLWTVSSGPGAAVQLIFLDSAENEPGRFCDQHHHPARPKFCDFLHTLLECIAADSLAIWALALDRMQKRGHVSDIQNRDFVARSGILLPHHS